MAAQLELFTTHHPRMTLVTLVGELDIATADVLTGTLNDLIRRGHITLALDVSGLRFCDSTGLEAFLLGHDEAWKNGGSLRLIGVHGILERVLELTRSRAVFEIDDAIEELPEVVVAGLPC